MKKFLITLLLIAIPSFVLAVPTSVDRVTNFIQPLIRSDFIKATYFMATSTTATSTFAGSLMVGNAMNGGMMTPGGGIVNTGQVPFQSSTNINDLTNSVATGNMSQGAYAADCHSQYNASTSPFLGLTATNYFANCFSGPNFNSATAPGGGLIYGSVIPGLPANSYVQAVQPGAMLFGALGTDIAKAWMSWSIGSGYQVGNYDMILKNVDTAGSTNTASGGLGLGTTTPDARLTLLASSTSTFDYFNIYQHVNGVTTGVPVFNVHKNENVGIASTTPWGRLSVNPNGITGPSFVVGSSTRTSFIVTNGGNVGIGTATPGKKLTVNGPVYVLADTNYGLYLGDPSDANSRPRIVQNGPANIAMYNTFQDNSVSKFSWGYGGVGTVPAYSFFISRTSDFSSPDFLLTPTGITALGLFNNVGIGTTTPWAKLSVNPNGIAGPAFAIGSSTATKFIVTNGGKVGIGTTSPWQQLSIVGTVAIDGLTSSTAGNAVCILTTKDIVDAGNTTCATSAGATKKNINELTSNEVKNILLNLKPVSFNYKESGDRRVGFIAEDVAKIDSRLVEYAKYDINYKSIGVTIKKGQPVSVEYANLTSVITKFVQGFYDEFQSLVAKVSGLEKRVNDQELRIRALELKLETLKLK